MMKKGDPQGLPFYLVALFDEAHEKVGELAMIDSFVKRSAGKARQS
jgi:hypothetical protein